MLKWLKERNNWHYIGGAILEITCYLIAFQAYQFIGKFLIATIIVSVGCFVWEMFWADYKNIKQDMNDVKKGIIAAVVTGVLCVITNYLIVGEFR